MLRWTRAFFSRKVNEIHAGMALSSYADVLIGASQSFVPSFLLFSIFTNFLPELFEGECALLSETGSFKDLQMDLNCLFFVVSENIAPFHLIEES